MQKIILKVENSCTESWENMQTTENGKFCGICQKNVVDFSIMNDAQIIEFFQNYEGGKLCKKIKKSQQNKQFLVNKKVILKRKINFWKIAALTAGIFIAATSQSQGQTTDNQQIKQENQPQDSSQTVNKAQIAFFKAEFSYQEDGVTQILANQQIDFIYKNQIYKSIKTNNKGFLEIILPREIWEAGFEIYWTNFKIVGVEKIAIHQRNKWLKIIFNGNTADDGVIWGD